MFKSIQNQFSHKNVANKRRRITPQNRRKYLRFAIKNLFFLKDRAKIGEKKVKTPVDLFDAKSYCEKQKQKYIA